MGILLWILNRWRLGRLWSLPTSIYYSSIYLEVVTEIQKITIRIVCNPAKIQSKCIQNTCLQHCYYADMHLPLCMNPTVPDTDNLNRTRYWILNTVTIWTRGHRHFVRLVRVTIWLPQHTWRNLNVLTECCVPRLQPVHQYLEFLSPVQQTLMCRESELGNSLSKLQLLFLPGSNISNIEFYLQMM